MAAVPVPLIDVAANVVRGPDGRVLLAERTAGQIAPGYWELPGGKIDKGETPAQAAARELDEEVGIRSRAAYPWMVYEYAFATRRVRLHLFRVEDWTGTPSGREGQRLAWVDPAAPDVAPLQPSNERALAALGLPRLFVETAGLGSRALALLPPALRAGVRLILVREPHLAPDQRIALARRIGELARAYAARVFVAGSALEARRSGASGLHSEADELRRATVRPNVKLWSVACRDAADLERARELGADLATLALPPAGWSEFARLTSGRQLPIYASGGTTPHDLGSALQAGAAGVRIRLAGHAFETLARNA